MANILVAEDDADISRLLCRILSKAGYEATPAYSGTEAKLRLEMSGYDLILLDLMLPGVTGEEIITYVRDELGKSIPIIVFSRENLYEQVWENGYYGEDNTVNVHVSNIRKKIAAADPGEEYIKTVWGIGFKMA